MTLVNTESVVFHMESVKVTDIISEKDEDYDLYITIETNFIFNHLFTFFPMASLCNLYSYTLLSLVDSTPTLSS